MIYKENNFMEMRLKQTLLKVENKIEKMRCELLKWFISVSVVQTGTFIISILTTIFFGG